MCNVHVAANDYVMMMHNVQIVTRPTSVNFCNNHRATGLRATESWYFFLTEMILESKYLA